MADTFVNKFIAPTAAPVDLDAALSPADPYDINFAFPIHFDTLSCPTVRLAPFVPSLHLRKYWENVEPKAAELFTYYSFCPRTISELVPFFESFRQNPEWCMFAVYDRMQGGEDGQFAGVMSLFHTSGVHLHTEIGFVLIFPQWQGGHVARTAIALLLRYCLEKPNARLPGLGFRRVQWCAHPSNVKSVGLAKRMGFREEGIVRWVYVISPDSPEEMKAKAAVKRGKDGEVEGYGRFTIYLGHCWDDWDQGGRELSGAMLSK